MGKIKTGISTDEEFRKSLTDKGANLRIDSTPKELLDAFLETGSFVSYQSPNEVIVQAVNVSPDVSIEFSTTSLREGEVATIEYWVGDEEHLISNLPITLTYPLGTTLNVKASCDGYSAPEAQVVNFNGESSSFVFELTPTTVYVKVLSHWQDDTEVELRCYENSSLPEYVIDKDNTLSLSYGSRLIDEYDSYVFYSGSSAFANHNYNKTRMYVNGEEYIGDAAIIATKYVTPFDSSSTTIDSGSYLGFDLPLTTDLIFEFYGD